MVEPGGMFADDDRERDKRIIVTRVSLGFIFWMV